MEVLELEQKVTARDLLKRVEGLSKKWNAVYSLLQVNRSVCISGVDVSIVETELSLLFTALDVLLLKVGDDHARVFAYELAGLYELIDWVSFGYASNETSSCRIYL